MKFYRRTVAGPVVFDGIGLHYGEQVRVTLHPSDQGIALRFGAERVLACPSNVTDTKSCTRIGSISTVEHLMSALAGAEITDVEAEFSAPEAPSLDGAAREWIRRIDECGIDSFAEREIEGPFTRIYKHHEGKKEKIALALGTGHWRYVFHSKDRYPFDQTFETLDVVGDYREQIAPARTFGWEYERQIVLDQGLAKGLSEVEGNVLILDDDGPTSTTLFPDEPTRHKLLDAIGDLYLSGVPIRLLNFVGEASGHRLNIEAAAHLASVVKWGE